MATIVGQQVVLRDVGEGDLGAIAAIMGCPGVVAWWGPFDAADFVSEMEDVANHPMLVEHDSEVVGVIQYSEEDDPMYRYASIDIALHDDHQGRGFGRDAVQVLVRYLFGELGHHRVTIDPALANQRAIRCYTAAGFQPVGVMRQYERATDGTWHDGLLMDLLASDVPGGAGS